MSHQQPSKKGDEAQRRRPQALRIDTRNVNKREEQSSDDLIPGNPTRVVPAPTDEERPRRIVVPSRQGAIKRTLGELEQGEREVPKLGESGSSAQPKTPSRKAWIFGMGYNKKERVKKKEEPQSSEEEGSDPAKNLKWVPRRRRNAMVSSVSPFTPKSSSSDDSSASAQLASVGGPRVPAAGTKGKKPSTFGTKHAKDVPDWQQGRPIGGSSAYGFRPVKLADLSEEDLVRALKEKEDRKKQERGMKRKPFDPAREKRIEELTAELHQRRESNIRWADLQNAQQKLEEAEKAREKAELEEKKAAKETGQHERKWEYRATATPEIRKIMAEEAKKNQQKSALKQRTESEGTVASNGWRRMTSAASGSMKELGQKLKKTVTVSTEQPKAWKYSPPGSDETSLEVSPLDEDESEGKKKDASGSKDKKDSPDVSPLQEEYNERF